MDGSLVELAATLRCGGGTSPISGLFGADAVSLVTTAEGRVLAFGDAGDEGQLGLGVGVEEALTPTAIDGITMDGGGEEGKEGKE